MAALLQVMLFRIAAHLVLAWLQKVITEIKMVDWMLREFRLTVLTKFKKKQGMIVKYWYEKGIYKK